METYLIDLVAGLSYVCEKMALKIIEQEAVIDEQAEIIAETLAEFDNGINNYELFLNDMENTINDIIAGQGRENAISS